MVVISNPRGLPGLRLDNESYFEQVRRMATEEYKQEQHEYFSHMPKSFWIFSLVMIGLIAMFIAVLYYSPINMNWLIFLTSLFGGAYFSFLVFHFAKTGKLGLPDTLK